MTLAVVRSSAPHGKHLQVAVDDIGIFLDIDSQEEYQKLEQAYAAKRNESASTIPAVESREGPPLGRAELVVAGRDAVAQALVKLGRLLNFTVTVVDPLLALAELPEADRILHVLDFSSVACGRRTLCSGCEPGTI